MALSEEKVSQFSQNVLLSTISVSLRLLQQGCSENSCGDQTFPFKNGMLIWTLRVGCCLQRRVKDLLVLMTFKKNWWLSFYILFQIKCLSQNKIWIYWWKEVSNVDKVSYLVILYPLNTPFLWIFHSELWSVNIIQLLNQTG